MVQRTILNDLLYDAAKAYWTWWQQYQVKLLFHQAIKNAEERFRLVKTSCRIGERSAIDTVEALAQRVHARQGCSFAQVRIAAADLPKVLPARDGVYLKNRFRAALGLPPF